MNKSELIWCNCVRSRPI